MHLKSKNSFTKLVTKNHERLGSY